MSAFINAMIRQVGRDMGKVISNQVFKDAHSTPYRRVGHSPSYVPDTAGFEKAISFKLSYKPQTLVEKLIASFVCLKGEMKSFLKDDYLDSYELQAMLDILDTFSSRYNEVLDIITLNGINTAKIERIGKQYVEYIQDVMKHAIRISKNDIESYEETIRGLVGVKAVFNFRKKKIFSESITAEKEKIKLFTQILKTVKRTG